MCVLSEREKKCLKYMYFGFPPPPSPAISLFISLYRVSIITFPSWLTCNSSCISFFTIQIALLSKSFVRF